jgi:hypothetical protein
VFCRLSDQFLDMNEKLIEKKVTKRVRELKGLAVKLFSPWFTGLPDRLILLPGARIRFAEFKTTGKGLSPRQKIVIPILISLGFQVDVVDDEETLNNFLKTLEQ